MWQGWPFGLNQKHIWQYFLQREESFAFKII